MLRVLNHVSRKLQSYGRGIPKPGALIYSILAVKMLRTFHRAVAREIAGHIDRGVVLDIGCGTASLLIELAKAAVPSYLLGLDISLAMARIARENLYRSDVDSYADIVVADAHMPPFRTNSIDIAISTSTLHHIAQPTALFRECSRIVRKMCLVYEFSHDAPDSEVSEVAKLLKRPVRLLKLVSALHGIPRSEYLEGAIARALRGAGTRHEIEFRGFITRLRIYPSPESKP